METYEVVMVCLRSGAEAPLFVEADEAETTESIVLRAQAAGQTVAAADYCYLPAYQKFRDRLLQLGYGLKCNGSRINAVQSGMMGANDRVYLVEMGKKAQRSQLVSLWDYADIREFPDTRQQLAFFKRWAGL